MRPTGRWARPTLQLITYRYLRYVLIRCLVYTNARTVAQRIAVYTLITSRTVAPRLRRNADLGIVVDTILQMVGDDQCRNLRSEISDLRFAEEPPAFAMDARMCEAAGAINSVRRLGRQLLVFRHVEGIDVAGRRQDRRTRRPDRPGRVPGRDVRPRRRRVYAPVPRREASEVLTSLCGPVSLFVSFVV